MDLREIRIGNYFEINTEGQPCPDRLENGIYKWDNWYDYYEFGFNENIFRPIPLTEEWLERMGFENYSIDCDSEGFNHIDVSFHNKSVTVYLNDYEITFIQHVHQLQNLYFALTGKEL